MGLSILGRQPLKGQIRCKRWFARCFWVRIFLFLHWIWKNWRIRRHNISCVLADREKIFLNGKQSEVPVNHPLKGRPFKRVTYKANKTKRTNLYISQGKSANSFTISVKDEQGNLFDFKDMRTEFVSEILYYMTAARKDRVLVVKWWRRTRPTNQPGRNSKKGNPRKILTIFDQRQIYFRQEPCALLLINNMTSQISLVTTATGNFHRVNMELIKSLGIFGCSARTTIQS